MRYWKLIGLVFMGGCMAACSSGVYKVTDKFEGVPTPPKPDYTNASHWAALPEKRDAADSLPKGIALQDNQIIAKADVFFIHPTIFTGEPTNRYRWNADVTDEKLNKEIQASTILNQATAFNGSCKVYAPYYRQAHLYAFYTSDQTEAKKALDLAYEDVKAAFETYLNQFNNGRPIVIASHSQGSYHAERLLKEYFDGKPLREKLVAAYLIGRAIKPNAFTTILTSEKPNEVGVWSSWNTFAKNHYPKNYERYFMDAQSTNPLLWNSSDTFAPKELSKGGVGPKFTYYPQLADAQNHAGMLWISKPYIKGRAFIRTKRWHYADINLFYMNIRENVELRIQQYLEQNVPAESNK
jgi:hypothetical protein